MEMSRQTDRCGSADDYDVVRAAVMETERGRWFLEEFARRNRAAETNTIITALSGVEARLSDAVGRGVFGDEQTAKARRLIERGASRVRQIRRIVTDAQPSRSATRLLRVTADLENALRLALLAIGGRSAPDAIKPQAVGDEEIRAPAVVRSAFASLSADPIERDLEPGNDGPENPSLASESVEFGNQRSRNPTDPEPPNEPALALVAKKTPQSLDERPVFATQISPLKLPTAWTPGLLESMREEDRAVLFA